MMGQKNKKTKKKGLAEKYRPLLLGDIIGNSKAVASLKLWAERWKAIAPQWKGFKNMDSNHELFRGRGRGFRPAVVLSGPPGIGKTSCAQALAREMGWDWFELNASDARNAERIKNLVTRSVLNQGLKVDQNGNSEFNEYEGNTLKLIILDEADNLYEGVGGESTEGEGGVDMSDRGGKREILQAIRMSRHPIILIVNDWYGLMGKKSSNLHDCTATIRFNSPKVKAILERLKYIVKEEGATAERLALWDIATRSKGDIRGAINDLESILIGSQSVTLSDVTSIKRGRNKKTGIFDNLKAVLLKKNLSKAIESVNNSESDLGMVNKWVCENVPRVYNHPGEVARAMDVLSRADVLEGRIFRQQYYGFRKYSSQLISGGVCMAKKKPHRWTAMQFPGYLKSLAGSRARREVQKSLARKMSAYLHVSTRYALISILPYMRLMALSDTKFMFNITFKMRITRKELNLLIDRQVSEKLWEQYLDYRRKTIGKGVRKDSVEGIGSSDDKIVTAVSSTVVSGPRKNTSERSSTSDPGSVFGEYISKRDHTSSNVEETSEQGKGPQTALDIGQNITKKDQKTKKQESQDQNNQNDDKKKKGQAALDFF